MHTLRALALLALFTPVAAAAQPPQWVEGVHYEVVDVPYDAPADGTIEVVELFWYGCGSCFQFEPHVERWLETKPADVRFVRVAATMAPAWRTHARAFYTADALDVVDRVHGHIFRALHVEREALDDVDAFARFFAQHAGVDADTFRRTWDSFGVETQVRRGDQFARRYQLTGVPAVIVAGKYRTNPSRAEGYDRLVALIDHLVALERGGPPDPDARPAPPSGRADTDDAPDDAAPDDAQAADEPATGERGALPWWLLAGVLVVVVLVVAVAARGRNRR